ncbi:MAG TPA: alpha-ketoacid dehydrogenase subunit beta [Dehalococcoidia bacterium]
MPEITYREAISQALQEELNADERVFLMGEDIGAYGGSYAVTKGFLEAYGEKRVRDTPISEEAIVGCAIGAAMGGLKPIAELMTINFSLLAMDQIVNNAAKILYMSGGQVPVPFVLRTVSGGGLQLGAQHSQSLESWYAQVPGLVVVAPATPYDAKGLLKSAIREPNPVLFVEHSLLYRVRGEVPEGDYTVPIGEADVKREGKDVTIVAYLRTLGLALEVADRLAREEGVEAEVVDLRTLRPLDLEPVFASVKKTNRAVIVEDAWQTGGLSGEIAGRIQDEVFDWLDAPVKRLNAPDVPMPYARNLEQLALPTADQLYDLVLETLQ